MAKMGLIVGLVVVAVLIIGGLFLLGEQKKEMIEEETLTVTPEVEGAVPELIPTPAPTLAPTPPLQLPSVKEFSIAIDERNINPEIINVNKGDTVKITFNFNDANIYFGGLDVHDSERKYIDIHYTKGQADKSIDVQFIAEKSFYYRGYWPSTTKAKAGGNVVVG